MSTNCHGHLNSPGGLCRAGGIRVSQQMVGKSAARFVPLIGAAGVGLYAYRDTRAVARAAIALFEDASAAPDGDDASA